MRWRETLRLVHLCIGGVLSVPLVVLGLSGSVLVLEPELTPLFAPSLAAASAGPAHSPAHSYAEIATAARAAAPSGTVPSLLIPPAAPDDPVELRFSDPQRPGPGGVRVFVDPASLAVRGVTEAGDGPLRQVFFLHANLMMRDRGARAIVGWFGVAMCALGFSGLVMQWTTRRRLRRALTVDQGARGHFLLRQIHGATGMWFFAVFITISFSGVWLAFPQTFNGAAASLFGTRDLRPGIGGTPVTPLPGATALDIDGAVALAHAAVPDGLLRSIALPLRPEQPFRVALVRDAGDALPVLVFVDPWARRVIEQRDPQDYTLTERVVASMHAIHEGRGLGWPWRVLVFLSGLLPALFAGSGITMWLMKRRARHRGGIRAGDAIGMAGDWP